MIEIKTARVKCDWPETIRGGWGNGYIGVPPDHPYHGLDCDAINISIHGGLTYAGKKNPKTKTKDGYWWIGFDTMHHYDDPASYDLNFVEAEIARMLRQAREAIK